MSNDATVAAYFGNIVSADLFRVICGRELGFGEGRTVYECDIRPDLVIKIETPSHSFQNQGEWRFWNDWRHDADMRTWLAPCEAISPCGTVLLQQRTQPIPREHYPKRLPQFLTDTKRSNFGLLEGRIVCHDYGLVVSEVATDMVEAEWWE